MNSARWSSLCFCHNASERVIHYSCCQCCELESTSHFCITFCLPHIAHKLPCKQLFNSFELLGNDSWFHFGGGGSNTKALCTTECAFYNTTFNGKQRHTDICPSIYPSVRPSIHSSVHDPPPELILFIKCRSSRIYVLSEGPKDARHSGVVLSWVFCNPSSCPISIKVHQLLLEKISVRPSQMFLLARMIAAVPAIAPVLV